MRFQPASRGLRRARDFGEDGKLRGIGVLRFVKNDTKVFLANAPRGDRMMH